MKALFDSMTRRARTALACASGLLVMACGGSDEAAQSSSAAASVAVRETATAVAATEQSPRRKTVRARAWRGVTAMDVAPDGSIAIAGADGSVQTQPENASGRAASAVMAEAAGVAATAVAFSADGKHLVGVGRDSVARVWDVASRTARHQHARP